VILAEKKQAGMLSKQRGLSLWVIFCFFIYFRVEISLV